MVETQRFCPNCGSTDVGPDMRKTNLLGEAVFNQNKWLCNECGYTGIMPEGDPEDESSQEMDFEPPEDYPQQDFDAGRAYFKYFIYISIPALIIYFLYLQL
ncbi:MAG: hypothetical protein H8Z69_03795 [Nanohaloarchaea archaeon]|nr:hypothetical protein [Candidatus Nanohaloarchaea archaeon]